MAFALRITPGGILSASTFEFPYVLTNTGTTAITSFTIDLHNSLIAGIVFDPYGTFGDDPALDFTPDGSNPVTATWAFGPTVITEGGYKTLSVTLDGAGLEPGQTFSFRVDVDPASIDGPNSSDPNHPGSVSGFEHLGASVTVNYAVGASQTAEVFSDGSAGGGQAVIGTSLMPEVSLKIFSADGTPLVTDQINGIIKANLPGLDAIAGVAGIDVIVEVTGTPGQDVRLSVAEIGGVGIDIPLGSHEGNLVLQDPIFIDATIGSSGTVSVPIALPAVTSTAGLEAGSVSGLFAVTAALVNTATGEATSLVSQTLVVKDAPNASLEMVTAINVGGQQFTAANGITYLADPGPTTGTTNAFATVADIVGTTDDPLYNTERWTSGGSYTYEIPVANGTYLVELNFAEIYSGITGAGQRVFDMSLENQPLSSLQNIDIYGQVGANAPFVIDQLVTVTDGSLSIQVGQAATRQAMSRTPS